IADAAGVPTLPPDALHLRTEGVPDPTDESLELLEPIDDLEPEEEETADVAAEGEEAAAPATETDAETAPGFDPVRLYLRQMAQNGLLTREGEVVIAKRIEAG